MTGLLSAIKANCDGPAEVAKMVLVLCAAWPILFCIDPWGVLKDTVKMARGDLPDDTAGFSKYEPGDPRRWDGAK